MKNKILTALISALVAIAAWLYVVTVISPNSDKHFYNIPIDDSSKVILHERNLMMIKMDVDQVDVHLEGNRIDLNKLTSKDIEASIDFESSNIFDAGTHQVKINVVVSDVVDIQSKTPDKAVVEIVERKVKMVPVVADFGDTKVHSDYIKDEEKLTLDISEIQIAGPKSVVDQVSAARVKINLNGRKDSIDDSFPLALCDKNGDPVDTTYFDEYVESVKVAMPIIRVKKVMLRADVVPGGGATVENTAITWEPETITVTGSEEKLNSINELVFGKIDLGTILENETISFPLKLDPELACVSGITEVLVSIELPELTTRTLTIKDFVAENLPDNTEVEFLTQAVDIQVRGPKENVEALDPEKLEVKVDFTNTELGKVIQKATLVLNDEQIGVLGTYTVYADVKKK